MQLFYDPFLNSNTELFTFDKTESRHIIGSLRKKEGDFIYITNGKGQLFESVITNANDKKCAVQIKKVSTHSKTWNYYLHIAIAPTKLNDRFEWFLEKATEIGIDEITPLICDRSERKIVKQKRMEKIIHAAAKQSLKYQFPKLNNPVKIREFLASVRDGRLLIAHCDKSERKSLKSSIIPSQNTTILIGPEGDFSTKEIQLSKEYNFIPVSMGESRLRTETAGLVAVQSMALMNEQYDG